MKKSSRKRDKHGASTFQISDERATNMRDDMIAVCRKDDIPSESGVCALVDDKQVALFKTSDDKLYAIDNFDPFSKANVLSRGILGGTGDITYVASPIYKQRFDLATGRCLDDENHSVKPYQVLEEGGQVYIRRP